MAYLETGISGVFFFGGGGVNFQNFFLGTGHICDIFLGCFKFKINIVF